MKQPLPGQASPPATDQVADEVEGGVEPSAQHLAKAPVASQPLPVEKGVQHAEFDVDDDDEEDDRDDDEREADGDPPRRRKAQLPAEPPVPVRFADVVSGEFDQQVEAADAGDATAPKRVLLPQEDTPKLHKVLAQAGLGSRLEMEQLIMEGRISVNNEPAHIGQRIQFGDQIKVNGKPIRVRIAPPPARVIAYHKPAGEVVTHDDPQNRPTVFRKLPRLQQGKWQSVGRLDLNTEGLLLFTSSGELANRLMHPRFGLEREYAVRVLGALSNEEKDRLLQGIQLEDGKAQFGTIEDGGGEGANTWYRVTISEGRNREVRRLFEALGHAVSRLIRIRYGAMLLPRGLKRGAFMELDERDIRALMHAAGTNDGAERTGRAGRDEQGRDAPGDARSRGARNGRGRGPGEGNGNTEARGSNGQRGQRGQGGQGGQGGYQGGRRDGGQGGAVGGQGQQRRNKGRGDSAGGGAAQPDPMKTSLGYIGADSFTRQRQGAPGGPRRGGGGSGGGSGGRGGGFGGRGFGGGGGSNRGGGRGR